MGMDTKELLEMQVAYDDAEIGALKAHIELLRGAIEESAYFLGLELNEPYDMEQGKPGLKRIVDAYNSTPSQSRVHVNRQAVMDGYEQGHHASVGPMCLEPDASADEYIEDLKGED